MHGGLKFYPDVFINCPGHDNTLVSKNLRPLDILGCDAANKPGDFEKKNGLLAEIYQSCLSAFLLLQAKVGSPSFGVNQPSSYQSTVTRRRTTTEPRNLYKLKKALLTGGA